MQYSSMPTKFPIPFAKNAGGSYTRVIPQASQIGITPGAASLNDGFPPQTFSPVGSGGTPPWGQDFNGILNQATAWNQWQQAGGTVRYDATFATQIGGYPAGAVLASTVIPGLLWYSTTDNNTTNPDGGGASGWVSSASAALGFVSGTALLFAQTAAPSGWTKSTTHNDKMLRIVSGTAGSGGSAGVSTAWSSVALSGTVAGHTLSVTELPAHTHSGTTGGQSATHTHGYNTYSDNTSQQNGNGGVTTWHGDAAATSSTASGDHNHSFTTDNGTGSGGSHGHGLSINSFTVTPAYVDSIICTKN